MKIALFALGVWLPHPPWAARRRRQTTPGAPIGTAPAAPELRFCQLRAMPAHRPRRRRRLPGQYAVEPGKPMR